MSTGTVFACAAGAVVALAPAAFGGLFTIDSSFAASAAGATLGGSDDFDSFGDVDLSDFGYAAAANRADGLGRFANGSGHITSNLSAGETGLSLFVGGSGSASVNDREPFADAGATGQGVVFMVFTLSEEFDVVIDYAISALYGGADLIGGSFVGLFEGNAVPAARGGGFFDASLPSGAIASDMLETGGYSEDEWTIRLGPGQYTFAALAVVGTEDYLGFRGRGGDSLNAFANASFTATLSMTLVPAPGAAALLGLAGALTARRRR